MIRDELLVIARDLREGMATDHRCQRMDYAARRLEDISARLDNCLHLSTRAIDPIRSAGHTLQCLDCGRTFRRNNNGNVIP